MKPLVFASYAQFGVDAGDEDIGRLVMAYESRPTIMETDYCGYSIRTPLMNTYGMGDKTCIVAKAMCSVACLEWKYLD